MSATESASRAARQIVVFSLAEEAYALPVTQVQEIIRYTEPRSVASTSTWIRGVISLRGRIIPVCDLGARIGLPASAGRPEKIVIVEAGSSTAGILVDDVQEVLMLEDGDVQPLPVSGSQSGDAIAKIGDRLVVLLDTSIFAALDGVEAAAA
jgi:purine-binding chemotaxis protein CheW